MNRLCNCLKGQVFQKKIFVITRSVNTDRLRVCDMKSLFVVVVCALCFWGGWAVFGLAWGL